MNVHSIKSQSLLGDFGTGFCYLANICRKALPLFSHHYDASWGPRVDKAMSRKPRSARIAFGCGNAMFIGAAGTAGVLTTMAVVHYLKAHGIVAH